MKTAFLNAKVYRSKDNFEEALLVDDNIISAIGGNGDILALCGDAEMIDCGGRTVIPGLNDSHLHAIMRGFIMNQPKVRFAKSIDEMVDKCRAYIAEKPELVTGGLFASGWNEDNFTEGEKRLPARQDLDKISTEIPVVLRRVCAHIAVGNSLAVEMLGMDGVNQKVPGGIISLGEDGKPDGIFYEKAVQKILDVVLTKIPIETKQKYLLDFMNEAVSKGLTSVQCNDLGTVWPNNKAMEDVVSGLYKDGRAPMRYRFQASPQSPDHLSQMIAEGRFEKKAPYDTDMLTFGDVKLFKDGTLGVRTAQINGGYKDDPGNEGIDLISQENLRKYIKICDENGLRIVLHTIGDRANEECLEAFEVVMKPGNPNRHALIHFQITTKEILDRALKLGLYVHYQPCFLNYDLHICEDRVGEELSSTSYAFNYYYKNGGKVSFSTDCPVEDYSPFPNIYCAATRKDFSGYPEGGWYPDECMDVSDCIDCYTLGSAKCEFLEERKGRLEKGYLADLLILDRDIFSCSADEIKDIKPLMTMCNGKIVYRDLKF